MSEGSRILSLRVIKWDGEAPAQWVLSSRWPFIKRELPNPVGHPRCREIVEIYEGQKPVVTYSRQE